MTHAAVPVSRDASAAALLELREPLPSVVDSSDRLATTIEAFTFGHGPLALDAERASGHRYFARAYLVQLRRQGAGTALVDPIPIGDLSALGGALADCEWVLHAASQDLACLAEIGMRPKLLFDTELAGRLLNHPKVGLAALVEDLLGQRLRKEHSAVDWSRRPLPEPWLRYAALDVEVLLELREILGGQLRRAGKQRWAEEEFAALVDWAPSAPRSEPWRRTSGLHRVRGRRGLAVVRELWLTRDQVARERDLAAGRLLPDAVICAIASGQVREPTALADLTTTRSRSSRRHLSRWVSAVEQAHQLPEAALPQVSATYDGPPPARAWPERDPVAAGRLAACREAMRRLADQHDLPVENLLAPDAVRRLAWQPPEQASADAVAGELRSYGARAWQVELTSAALAAAIS